MKAKVRTYEPGAIDIIACPAVTAGIHSPSVGHERFWTEELDPGKETAKGKSLTSVRLRDLAPVFCR
jgi:hypothetical protein